MVTEGPAVRWLRRALAHGHEPVDPAGLAAYRVLLGGVVLLAIVRFWAYGWIDELYLAPAYHFTYPGLGWIRPLPGAGLYVWFAAMAACAAGLTVGWRTRPCALLLCGTFTYVELIDKATYLNHYYLVSLMTLLLAVVPAGAAGSLDAARRRRIGLRPLPVKRYGYWLLRGQIAIVYLYAGVAKLSYDWLLRAEPLGTWLSARADLPLVGGLLADPLTAHAMSLFGAVFDCSLPLLLSWRRTRRAAFVVAIAFHVSVWLLFPIGVFSWVMLASLSLFLDPGWPRRWLHPEAKSAALARAGAIPGAPQSTQQVGMAAPTLALLYLGVQLLVPARCLLYPGNVNWHEQGFRFSWRVMLTEKAGQVDFDVLADGQRFVVYPRTLLTRLQYEMMSTQPDMIQQFAWHVRDRFVADGHREVRVFANAWANLNGRPSQRLVDPRVDLGATRASLRAAPWIVPLGAETNANDPAAAAPLERRAEL